MIEYRRLFSYLSALLLSSFCLPLAAQNNLDFGQVNVGSSVTMTVVLSFVGAYPIGKISVRTLGAENLDFTNEGEGSCMVGTLYDQNQNCTVQVTFKPTRPGPRYGAVVLLDSSNQQNVEGITYIQGTGNGAQIVFQPWGTPEDLGPAPMYPPTDYNGNGTFGGMAIDGNGNIFVATQNYGLVAQPQVGVTKWTPSNGGFTQSTVSAVGGPGIAIDGAGVLYYGCGTSLCEALPRGDGTYVKFPIVSGFGYVFGVAVDGYANIYLADNSTGILYEEFPQWDGTYQQATIATGLDDGGLGIAGNTDVGGVAGIALDANGDVFAATQGLAVYKETPSNSGYTQTNVDKSSYGSVGVAVDHTGNVYVADENLFYFNLSAPLGAGCSTISVSSAGLPALLEETPQPGGSYLATTIPDPSSLGGYSSPSAVAFGDNGDLYFVDSGLSFAADGYECTPVGEMYRYTPNHSSPPSFDFGSHAFGSTSSPQVVTISNPGNTPLIFSSISFPVGFVEDSAAKTDCKVNVAIPSNGSCTISIDFKPLSTYPGSPLTLSGDVTLTSNSLIGPQQNIAVTGRELAPAVLTPGFSPAPGSYPNAQSVTISDATSGAQIYYTLNGTRPTPSSTKYTGPVSIKNSYTLQAVAVISGNIQSSVASGAYQLTAATPVATPAGGRFTTAQTVTLTTASTSARVYYTTNGAAPTVMSTLYTGPITVSASETVKAIAAATGYTSSAVAANAYVIAPPGPAATPTFLPAAGTYSNAQTVTISDTTPGAIIHYTLNGTTPTTSSTKYTGPIAIKGSYTLQAIAEDSPDYTVSAVGSAVYKLVAATPVVSLAGATYTGPQTVTVTTASTGAGIFYTTNGGTPTASSTRYTGPITVSKSETLKMIAIATGYTSSPVVTEVYTIH